LADRFSSRASKASLVSKEWLCSAMIFDFQAILTILLSESSQTSALGEGDSRESVGGGHLYDFVRWCSIVAWSCTSLLLTTACKH
jgi:hypothetical protein